MGVTEITRAIINGGFDNDELNAIGHAILFARSQLGKQIKRKVTLGSYVSFVGRAGVKLSGTVKKISTKNVIVATPSGQWKVPASMLTVDN